VYILCDCSQAIEIIVKRSCFAIRFEVFKRLAHLQSVLSEMNVKIVLAWIPGRQGIKLKLHVTFIQADYLLPALSLTMMRLRLQLT